MFQMNERQLKYFFDRVSKTPEGCWLWTGYINHDGYGVFNSVPIQKLAHRAAFEHFKGEIPQGFELDHLCRVRNCVNYETHLEPVTHRVNTLRGKTLPAKNLTKTHCPKGHPYDEVNTLLDRTKTGSIKRKCRTCVSVKTSRLYWRKKQQSSQVVASFPSQAGEPVLS